jgi:hypothetical protein
VPDTFPTEQTWYRPHATETHRAFPISWALWICLVSPSCPQSERATPLSTPGRRPVRGWELVFPGHPLLLHVVHEPVSTTCLDDGLSHPPFLPLRHCVSRIVLSVSRRRQFADGVQDVRAAVLIWKG